MTGHEGSHKSFSKSPWRNSAARVPRVPDVLGTVGSLYWRNKHDRLHHGHPNVEGVDPDIKPFPFVSSTGDHEKSTPGLRWFQRNLQRTVFWPMSTLMALGMRRSSILYLARLSEAARLHGRGSPRSRCLLDALHVLDGAADHRVRSARRHRGVLARSGRSSASASRSCSHRRTWACRSPTARTTIGFTSSRPRATSRCRGSSRTSSSVSTIRSSTTCSRRSRITIFRAPPRSRARGVRRTASGI